MLKVCWQTVFRSRMHVSGQDLAHFQTSLSCLKETVKLRQVNIGKTRLKRDKEKAISNRFLRRNDIAFSITMLLPWAFVRRLIR